MSDILKHLGRQSSLDPDIQDRMAELEEWNESMAIKIAEQQGIALTDDHWDVIHYLRRFFLENGQTTHARHVSDDLKTRYEKKGGNKFLYELFPEGPVTQGYLLAGLPAISDSKNSSFGSVS